MITSQLGREFEIIREALMRDWDPHRIANHPTLKLSHEYESFIGTVHRILAGNRSQEDLIDFFHGVEAETRGPFARTREELGEVARKFLTLPVKQR